MNSEARVTHWFTFTVITDADGTVDRTTSLLASVMPMIQTMNARNTLNPHLNKRTPPSPQSQSVPAPLTEAPSHSQPHPAQRKGAIWKLSRIPRLLMLGYATDERQRRLVSVLFHFYFPPLRFRPRSHSAILTNGHSVSDSTCSVEPRSALPISKTLSFRESLQAVWKQRLHVD